ncbi:MAG: hypothetical protein Q9174_006578 [Haloplaca sp. 1 TL-2023]
MGHWRKELILEHDLDNRVVTFPDGKQWKLTKKLSAKAWEGSDPSERAKSEDWRPDEEHAVYECVQVQGSVVGTEAIIKVRVEVRQFIPHDIWGTPTWGTPEERAKEASGMRFNYTTTHEIETLQELTAAGCSATPRLLGVMTDIQDSLAPPARTETPDEADAAREIQWCMPGGYIVYVLMEKLRAEPLGINTYWDEKLFSKRDRDDIRASFKESWMSVTLRVNYDSTDDWQRAQKPRHSAL